MHIEGLFFLKLILFRRSKDVIHSSIPKKRFVLPFPKSKDAGKIKSRFPGGFRLPEAYDRSLKSYFPFDFARLKKGETVLDLGCGGGADALKAARYVGAGGRVYGLERSREVLKLAEFNKRRMGIGNVRFIRGRLENIPLMDASVDAVISNLVFHLVKNKAYAIREACRVLKTGGRIAMADIICIEKPKSLRFIRNNPVSGFLQYTWGAGRYARTLKEAGFKKIRIYTAPDEAFLTLLAEYLSMFEKELHYDIRPVVVYAKKSLLNTQ